MKKTDIIEVVSGKLAPFIILFGLYLVSFGHLSPGGGFQGGVVIASGVILLFLGRRVKDLGKVFPLSRLALAEALMFFLFLMMGTIGLFLGKSFLWNFLPVGTPGELPSATFIFFMNIVIGVKVGAGVSLVCLHLLEEE